MKNDLPSLEFDLFSPQPQQLRLLKPVTALDMFENNTENFHPEGLFSTEIFGRVGSAERDTRFAFINLKANVFHPLYYRQLHKLKRLYTEIMTGKSYAVWNEKTHDFDKSNEIDGDTGYAFFLKHWEDIKFKRNDSHQRSARIDFIEKTKDSALIQYIIVLPAGLRDVSMGSDGRTTEGEVNADYRRLIGISNNVTTKGIRDETVLNTFRCTAQNAFNNIYAFFNTFISGKNGFIMDKWASRNLENGTRTVITGASFAQEELGDESGFSLNSTIVGLFQTVKAIEPVVMHHLLTGIIQDVFIEGSTRAKLIDPETLHRVEIELDTVDLDKWTTSQGLVKVTDNYQHQATRNNPVKIKGHYMALVYKDDESFKVFYDIDDLPSNLDAKKVSPLTYTELLYLSYFEDWNKIPVLVTRYPITGTGSIYPSYTYVKTTTTVYRLAQRDENWEISDKIAYCYPETNNPAYIDTAAPHSSRLGGLGADNNFY